MTKVLYVFGILSLIAGAFLVYPAVSPAIKVGDPLAVLGAPIVMNGITLIFYGILILFLGRLLSLMQQIAKKTIWLDAWDSEGKVLVKCPKCQQQLRVVSGKSGSINCPKCGNQFDAET